MNYDWGSTSAIAELQGRVSKGQPEAELWMGTHRRAPSPLEQGLSEASDLRALIASDPVRLLGDEVARRFGDLPFLLKVLAADRPLSLQAHPTVEQARLGFEREERAGIEVDAPTRNYKDNHHKPELILALSDFWALSGFRPPEESLELFRVLIPGATRTFAELLLTFERKQNGAGIEGFFRGLLALPLEDRRVALFILKREACCDS